MPSPPRLTRAPRIYLDHAATAPLCPEAASAMEPFLREAFGNPSSIHAEGRQAREALEDARERIRRALGAGEFDLLFVSGGTEADLTAIAGVFLAAREDGRRRIVASAVEHPAVLNALGLVGELSGVSTVVPVDRDGRIDPGDVRSALGDDTALVTVMMAQNEVGTLEPVEDVAREARRRGALVHTDAVQAAGKVPIDLGSLPVDLVTISSHKVHGPKGIAGLLVRKGTRLRPLVRGGSQEGGLRAGTENVAAAVGFAAAVELAVGEREGQMLRIRGLRDRILQGIAGRFPGVVVNTPREGSLPTIVNVSFPRIEGESLVRLLDAQGIAASTGSACSVGSRKPSHVLAAMGRSEREVRGSLRLSLGRGNTEEDVDVVFGALEEAVGRLERIAPGEG